MTMTSSRRIHRFLGWCLILPFMVWTLTAIVFFIKPGYQAAFAALAVQTYPISNRLQIIPQPHWQEVKVLNTVLGLHLLVKLPTGWQQLNPVDFSLRAEPSTEQLKLLLQDAISIDPQRYGHTLEKTPDGFVTETGVQIQLDWTSMSVSQQGKDTELINNLYKAHYVQWTGHKVIDQLLGVLALLLLMLTTVLGIRLLLGRR